MEPWLAVLKELTPLPIKMHMPELAHFFEMDEFRPIYFLSE